MAKGTQPKIKRSKASRSKSQPTIGSHARKVASQRKLGGNRKRRAG